MERDEKIRANSINMAYNMKIIQAIWKCEKGDFGEEKINGNEYNTSSFYGIFEKSRQTVRDIIYMEYLNDAELNLDGNTNRYSRVIKWAKKLERKMGVSADIFMGKKRICLSNKFDRESMNKYLDYVNQCADINDFCRQARKRPVNLSTDRIKKIIETKGTQKQKDEFKEVVEEAEAALYNIKKFDDDLTKEITRLSKRDGYTEYDDVETYKLFHFIKYGKPYDAASIVTIDNVIEMFNKTRAPQLKSLGKYKLKEYIEAMKKQISIAEAVYTIWEDIGKF